MRISLLKLGPARPGCSGLVQSSLEHLVQQVNNFQFSAVLIAEQSWHGRGEREDHVGEITPCQNPDVSCGASKAESGEHKEGTVNVGNS